MLRFKGCNEEDIIVIVGALKMYREAGRGMLSSLREGPLQGRVLKELDIAKDMLDEIGEREES